MKTYARCVWVEENELIEEEDTILASWVDEALKTVRWPTKINALRAMREMRDPEPNWKTFTLVKVKFRSGKFFFDLRPESEESLIEFL